MERVHIEVPFRKIVLGPMTNPILALQARITHDEMPACTITISIIVLADFVKMYACELVYETAVRFTYWGSELEVSDWLQQELGSEQVTLDFDFAEDTL